MDIFALLLGIALAAGVYIFISRPLRQARRSGDAESRLETLLARRESLYTQIRELDFDHATGKITDADHAPLRARLVDEAADVLRQIDALTGAAPSADALEAAIAARRKRKLPTAASVDADIEAAIAARRKRQPETTASDEADLEAVIAAHRKKLTCPNCGKPVNAGDAFCAKCGAAIGTQVAR
jgi:hypothetical protein